MINIIPEKQNLIPGKLYRVHEIGLNTYGETLDAVYAHSNVGGVVPFNDGGSMVRIPAHSPVMFIKTVITRNSNSCYNEVLYKNKMLYIYQHPSIRFDEIRTVPVRIL